MNKKANDALRTKYTDVIREAMAKLGEDVLVTGSNEIAFPVVDINGEDNWVTVTVKVPTGSRDGEPYDGYGMATDYEMKVKVKAEKAAKDKAAKEAKIARDKAIREAKKAAKEKAKNDIKVLGD